MKLQDFDLEVGFINNKFEIRIQNKDEKKLEALISKLKEWLQ